jgi:3-oxoadipate enol-lactonase
MQMPYAELTHVRLHYSLEGREDMPLLVLVHSLGTSLTLWNDVTPALASRHRILRYDLRGHGKSSVPAGPYSIADLSQDLLELLELLKVDCSNICGLSIGGQIAMWLGAHVPRRFGKLIMANTAARIGTVEGWNERIARVHSEGLSGIADEAMTRWFTDAFGQRAAARVTEMRSALAATSAEGYIASCAALRDSDLSAVLPLIEAPVMVICGASDPVTTTGDGRSLAGAMRRASLIELDAAHISAVEQPVSFSSAALDFLNSEEVGHG